MAEIGRVLRPGGVCYFAAGNRWQWREPHYRLPLLSVVPRAVANLYLRLLGRGSHYYEKHRSHGSLRRLVRDFELHDYTLRLIREPRRFALDYLLPPASIKQRLASAIAALAPGLIPTYIWLLEKRA
jgi:SAM-dependent methyltransferase